MSEWLYHQQNATPHHSSTTSPATTSTPTTLSHCHILLLLYALLLLIPPLDATHVMHRRRIVDKTISCVDCASKVYEPLWSMDAVLREHKQRPSFGSCERHSNFAAPMMHECRSACLTVIEYVHVGGIQDSKSTRFYRGCADRLLNDYRPVGSPITNRPVEIDYLLKHEKCLQIPASEIWPTNNADESVWVCSCLHNKCNIHLTESTSTGSGVVRHSTFILTLLSAVLAYLAT